MTTGGMIHPEAFREYDIRGRAKEDLTPEFTALLGLACGEFFQEQGEDRVLVGRDNRDSSPRIRDDLIRGLLASGCRVLDIGTVITPIFYYARILYAIDGGVMITGSHNPPEDNGFKIASGPATIYGEQIQELRDRMMKMLEEDPRLSILERGRKRAQSEEWVSRGEPAEQYLEMLADRIHLGNKKPRVVVDCGNGTASLFAVDFFERLGCEEVHPLYCTSDPSFPNHHPDPVKTENLAALRQEVLKKGCDLGIGFDGDADRLGVIDDQGSVVWGDGLMCIFWREILPQHPGTQAIIEVKCSQALVDEVERLGGKPVFYKTGHSLIKAKMRELDAVFTGEMSGHMFFADEYYGFDDAFYAAGRLLRILSKSERDLSDMVAEIPEYHSTAETRIPCADEVKFEIVEELAQRFKEDYEVIDVDGARVLFLEGWGLVRASNTQPAIVARCEGKTREALEGICERMKKELDSFDEVEDFEWAF